MCLLLCLSAVACEPPVAAVAEAAWTLPALDGPQSKSVPCSAGKLTDKILACVDGEAVTREDYDRVVNVYPEGTKPAAIVAALVDAKVLANAAKKADLWGSWLRNDHKRATVAAYLKHHFEDQYTWEDVAEKDLRQAWRDWRFRIRYVREPSYFATDAQLLCCSGDWRKCEIDETAQKCIDDFADDAKALHKLLTADPPSTPLEMKGKVFAMSHRFPRAAVTDVNFYYLKDVPHEEQIGKGYEVMVEQYAKVVTAMKPGEISAPIRTPFGWHITRLNTYEPPLKGKMMDPEVRRDIADHILPLVRKRDVQLRAFELMKLRGVKVHFDEAIKKS